ncbi:uncharacterized protein METZ01_LOCUS448076 [marine metagenome]|uniref:Uncharacterized protein n=1 Tax=marine metagenome TaxID=408172 RepID=A0A382ZIC0_9ZZZZ
MQTLKYFLFINFMDRVGNILDGTLLAKEGKKKPP